MVGQPQTQLNRKASLSTHCEGGLDFTQQLVHDLQLLHDEVVECREPANLLHLLNDIILEQSRCYIDSYRFECNDTLSHALERSVYVFSKEEVCH